MVAGLTTTTTTCVVVCLACEEGEVIQCGGREGAGRGRCLMPAADAADPCCFTTSICYLGYAHHASLLSSDVVANTQI